MNSVQAVRVTTQEVCQLMRHVTIDAAAIDKLAVDMASTTFDFQQVAWDANDWHYSKDAADAGPLTCQYILVLDALNFCFWPTDGLQYEHLAQGLKRALEADERALDAKRLAEITAPEVEQWFKPFQVPQIEERVRKVQEIGLVLLKSFQGQAAELVKAAEGSAVALVGLLTCHFPGFRDQSVYKGRQIFFYKRAQIFVGDVWAAYGRQVGQHPYAFRDIDQLTMFADYRVPQLMEAMGALRYSSEIAKKIDTKEEIAVGSEEEIEIRAATVQAVEQLHQAIVKRGANWRVIELDWLLWQQGEELDRKGQLRAHHRTLTVFY